MQPVSLCILWCRQFEETFENPQWRKVKQMQPMQLCILWGKRFEETNATMHPLMEAVQGDIWEPTVEKSQTNATNATMQFEETFENPVGKIKKCNQCDYASSEASYLRRHLKIHSGEKWNKCNQCNFASSEASDLRRHLKTHSGEKPNKCNQCDFARCSLPTIFV